MLYAITPTAIKVATSAVGTATSPYVLGNIGQVGRLNYFATALRPFPGNISWIARQRRKLPVTPRGVVAHQTVHCRFRRRRRLSHILPAIAYMAGRTAGLVGNGHATKAVNYLIFAECLASFSVFIEPGPVRRCLDLRGCFGMTAQAGFSYFTGRFKRAFQGLELAVIGGGG